LIRDGSFEGAILDEGELQAQLDKLDITSEESDNEAIMS
jgi:hypothetical protein